VSTPTPDSARTALLDACVLIPIRLTATLLWLAEAGLFEALWSDAILDEVERNLPKIGISSEQAARRVGTMRSGFGAAALVDNFEHADVAASLPLPMSPIPALVGADGPPSVWADFQWSSTRWSVTHWH
jgi:hypothetical protein